MDWILNDLKRVSVDAFKEDQRKGLELFYSVSIERGFFFLF